jgi:hypothetical protein
MEDKICFVNTADIETSLVNGFSKKYGALPIHGREKICEEIHLTPLQTDYK